MCLLVSNPTTRWCPGGRGEKSMWPPPASVTRTRALWRLNGHRNPSECSYIWPRELWCFQRRFFAFVLSLFVKYGWTMSVKMNLKLNGLCKNALIRICWQLLNCAQKPLPLDTSQCNFHLKLIQQTQMPTHSFKFHFFEPANLRIRKDLFVLLATCNILLKK